MHPFARWLAFVALHAGLVLGYLVLLGRALPPLAGEDAGLVVAPATLVAAVALAILHPVVGRLPTHAGRLAALLVTAWAAMLVYAAYLAVVLRPEWPLLFVPLVLAFEIVYGAPLVLLVGVSAKVTSPLLVARPARGWT